MYGPASRQLLVGVAVSRARNEPECGTDQLEPFARLGEMLDHLMEGIHGKCVEYGDQADGLCDM